MTTDGALCRDIECAGWCGDVDSASDACSGIEGVSELRGNQCSERFVICLSCNNSRLFVFSVITTVEVECPGFVED